MQPLQKGFTLIGVMLVVAIAGILATIAISQYSDYTSRTQAAETAAELAAYKLAIEVCYQNTGALSNCNPGQFGAPQPVVSTNVKTITIANGVVSGTSTATTSTGTPMTFVFTPNPGVAGAATLPWVMTGTICDNARGLKPGGGLCI